MGEFRRDGPADLWWNLGPAGRVGLLILIAILLSALSAVVLLRSGSNGDAPPVIVREVTPTPTATPSPTPTATPALTATPATTGTATAPPPPTPTESPDPPPEAITPTPVPDGPAVGSIDELHSQYGEPPSAVLGRVRVPALGIDAPLGVRSVGGDGQMPNPAGPSDVVWYDFTGWEGFGGEIGGGNNAVFSGHVDYAAHVAYASVDFRGRGVFFSLSLLSPGDVIELESGGQTVRYAVSWRRHVDAVDGDWQEILGSDVPVDSITLITCGGEFNFESRSYVDRVVVRAERI